LPFVRKLLFDDHLPVYHVYGLPHLWFADRFSHYTGNEGSFYYSGDTALTTDMSLVPKWAKLNFAVLPIGDNFTMDATDAAECAGMIDCKKIVGVHYDTFGFIKIDHDKAKKAFEAKGAELLLVKIGETINI